MSLMDRALSGLGQHLQKIQGKCVERNHIMSQANIKVCFEVSTLACQNLKPCTKV